METPLAFTGFFTLMTAWLLAARRTPHLRLVDDAPKAGEGGFLRRLAG